MLKVFIAYRKDSDAWRDRVQGILRGLAKVDGGDAYPVTVWSDDHLIAGDEWESKIGVAIDSCDVFLLVVTTDLNGGYALEVELKRAIHRARASERCRIIPVIVDNVVTFLGSAGLTEFAFHAVPAGGKGLSQKPFQGHVDRWIEALTADLKDIVTRELSGGQWNGLDAGKSAEEVRSKIDRVRDALAEERSVQSTWPKVQYAIERTEDLLASGPDGVRDRVSALKRHVGEARRDARSARAARTEIALLELGASLDDLADAALLAGFQAYSDTREVTEVSSTNADVRVQLNELALQLDETDDRARALEAASAQQQKKLQKDFLRGAAARIGAETRLAKAAATSELVEPGLLVSTTEQLVETIEAVDVQAAASGLSAKPKAIIDGVARSAQRAQSTAIGIAAATAPGVVPLSGKPADEFVQASLDDPDYKVYTREFDEEVPAEQLMAVEDIERLFDFVTSYNIRGRTLQSALPKTLKQAIADRAKDTAIVILVDNSGSMRGRKIAVTAATVNQIGTVLARYEVPFEVLGFTTVAWKGGQSKAKWSKSGKPRAPGRLNDLRHIIYKDMVTSWDRAARNLGLMAADGLLKENIDGEAVLWAARRLLNSRRKRRVLLVISDGAPVDDSTLLAMPGFYLERHLKFVIGRIRELSDVRVLAIGIDHDASGYYPEAEAAKLERGTAEDIYPAVVKTMSRIFAE